MIAVRAAWAAGTLLGLLAAGAAAAAEVPAECEQLLAIVRSVIEHRDRGFSLEQILAGLREPEIERRLSAADLDLLRRAATAVFLGQSTPEEITLECALAHQRK